MIDEKEKKDFILDLKDSFKQSKFFED